MSTVRRYGTHSIIRRTALATQPERRAYQLALVGGTAGVIAVVGFILAAIDVMGFGIPFLAAIVAVVLVAVPAHRRPLAQPITAGPGAPG